MINFIKNSILIFPVILLVACWNTQDNEVTEPETPNYTLTGTVLDIDSKDPLTNISVAITYWKLAYPVEFEPQSFVTDSQGQFIAPNLVVGNYEFTIFRDGYPILIYNFSQGYEARNITIELPAAYAIDKVFNKISSAKFAVFDDTENKEASGIALIESDSGNEDNLFQFEFYLSNWDGTDSWKLPFTFNDIALVNLCYGPNPSDFYVMHSADANLYNFVIDEQSLQIAKQKTISFSGLDVFWWNNKLYISDKGMVGVFDAEALQLQEELSFTKSDAWLTSICRDSSNFWVSDINKQFLYQCDLNLNILKTYAPFYDDNMITIVDMAMDSESDIWFVIRD